MKKLILFVHGLGGSDDTWGNFQSLLKEDNSFSAFDVAFYGYESSVLRVKSILAPFSKLLSFIVPQQRLPKIQDVAELLKTEIEERYDTYDEIYLVTHSMGGLVARKYLYDMLKSRENLQVKKLMLYAVPNNGSDWAKLSKIYKHEQIEQLDRDSDFIQHLNKEVQGIDLEEYVDVLYVVGKYDDVVDESSAKGYWGNTKVKALPNTHTDIVKPKDSTDLSFIVLKNFLTDPRFEEKIEKDSLVATDIEAKETPFVKEVIEALNHNRLVVCYSQEHSKIATEQALLREKVKERFPQNVYDIEVPSFESDEAKYFQALATSADLRDIVTSANEWKVSMKRRLNKTQGRVLFFFSNISDGNEELDIKMAKIIRLLKNDHSNFYAICVGRKDLASLVHGQRKLSPLNTAIEIFFPLKHVEIARSQTVQVLNDLKNDAELLCECLADDWNESWCTWSYEESINRLFWKNILINNNGKYAWRDETTKEIAKEIFGC